MWSQRGPEGFKLRFIDPIVAVAGAALICTALTFRLSDLDRDAQLPAEALCWAVLPLLLTRFKFGSKPALTLGSLHEPAASSSRSLWIVAAGIVAASGYAAEVGVIYLLPLLTPLVLIAEKQLWPETGGSRALSPRFSFLSSLANTLWGTALVALAAIFALSDWNFQESALSVLPLAALAVVYLAFIPRTAGGVLSRLLPWVGIEGAIVPLSWRVVLLSLFAMGAQTAAFGLPSIDLAPTLLLLGLLRALSWYFTIQTAYHVSWCAAAAILTFGIVASRDPFIQTTDVEAILPSIASLFILAQIIHMLPEQRQSRLTLWALIFVSLGPYLANLGAIRVLQSSVLLGSDHSQEHPIEALVRNAKTEFDSLLQRQSKTYTAAEQEYRRRYHADPPPGFQAWYEYAVANQSPIIDEFDMIYEAVSPFWGLSGKEFVETLHNAANASGIDLWLCSFTGKTANTRCRHPTRKSDRHFEELFKKLLGGLPGALPDVQFLVNHLDEPRVLNPPTSEHPGTNITVTNLSERPTWDAITEYCPANHNNPRGNDGRIVDTFGIPFVTDRRSMLDLCRHPEYETMHGLFLSPASFRLITGLVPVLSSGAPSTMSDLLYPSPAYYTEREFLPSPSDDVPWDQKHNTLFWTGSNTGGVSHDTSPHWSLFHRQRFVHLAQNLAPQPAPHSYLRPSRSPSPTVTRFTSRFLDARLYAVHFTRIFQCRRTSRSSHPPTTPRRHTSDPCRAQRRHFRLRPWTASASPLRSKLVFDTDGNGISGRFYRLLASDSAVLKQTLLREWHDERLRPWVHYFPVSPGMGELPEMVRWLLGTGRGREVAREGGRRGAEWFGRAMRERDASVYVWRLLLELARLADEGREAGVPGGGEGQRGRG